MKPFRAWVLRFAGLFSVKKREREIAAEIDSHLQMHIDDNLRSGMTPRQARRAAILKLGGLEPAKEVYRDQSTVPILENLLRDIRFSIRQLQKNPGFTATAILMLGLGICSSVSIFGFVDAALIKPLPYRDPSRLVGVTESVPVMPRANLSYLDYLDWKKQNKVFDSLEVYDGTGYLLNTPGGSEPVPGARVSDGFFRTLGAVPMLGRDFYAGEDLAGTANTVILSYSTWRRRFGGKPDVIGRTVLLSGVPNTIVGVLPESFQFAPRGGSEFWTPLHPSGSCDLRRSCHNLTGIARLKEGVPVETALAEMKLIAQRLEKQYPDSNREQGAVVEPLSEVIAGNVRPVLLALLGGVALLLLIACVNVSSLLLVRSESRKREIAVRSSLGASRGRLMCQFVAEGLVLVAIGSLTGVASAHWTMQLLAKLIPVDMLASMPYLIGLGLNLRLLAFAGAISVLAALLFSLTPAFRLSSPDIRENMAEGSRGSAGNTWRRLGSRLVVLELATAMVLLAGAGLLGKSFYLLLHVELGFQPDRLATLDVAAPDIRYGENPQAVALGREIVSRISALPGVKAVAIANILPVSYNGNTTWIRMAGHPYHGEHNEVNQRDASSAYFTTIQARLLRGRYFTEAEDASKPGVMIINQSLARKYFPGEDPIGKRIGDTSLSAKSLREVIGVVEDIKDGSLDSQIWPAVYYPFSQSPDTYFSVVARTSQAPEAVLQDMTASIRRIDPELGTISALTMDQRINASPAAYLHRSSSWLVGGFAMLALLLGAVGLYGVTAYSVSRRTREIGVRMALGAQRGTVYRLILREAGWLTAVGIATGLLCSLGASALIRKLLFGVEPWDVPTLAAVSAVLAVSAMLASYVPAHRAASVNPADALRAE